MPSVGIVVCDEHYNVIDSSPAIAGGSLWDLPADWLWITNLSRSLISDGGYETDTVKPETFFGRAYSEIARDISGVPNPETQEIISSAVTVWNHYWGDIGEFTLWDYRPRRHLSPVAKELIKSFRNTLLTDSARSHSHDTDLVVMIPPVNLQRRLATVPYPTGKMRFIKPEGKEQLQQCLAVRLPVDALSIEDYVHLDIGRRAIGSWNEQKVWLSQHEYQLVLSGMTEKVEPDLVATTAQPSELIIPVQNVTVSAWEQLSWGVQIAHEAQVWARMSPEEPDVPSCWYQGLVRSETVRRARAFCESVPGARLIGIGAGRFEVALGSSIPIMSAIAASRDHGLLCYSPMGPVALPKKESPVAFDLLFELMLAQSADALCRANRKALSKGGII